jgi:hypothetical protein
MNGGLSEKILLRINTKDANPILFVCIREIRG